MNLSRLHRIALLAVGTAALSVGIARVIQDQRDGYRTTPILPGQKWHVHDPDRPYPHQVTPGATNADPPADAVVLFNGKDLSHWMQMRNQKPQDAKWKIVGDTLEIAPGTGSLISRDKFGDCQLHIEWQEPINIEGKGQGRGNSGVYLMGLFEVQILDSYHSATYADGQAAALYGQWPPLVNPQRPPGQWQTYDIIFTAPQWKGNKLVAPAYETVLFNGVLVHNHQKLNGPSGHQVVLPYEKGDAEGPILLQDHGGDHPLHFRNIWVRRLMDYDQPETPVR